MFYTSRGKPKILVNRVRNLSLEKQEKRIRIRALVKKRLWNNPQLPLYPLKQKRQKHEHVQFN